METTINDAIEDHIVQLEDYLEQIENTFSLLSLDPTYMPASLLSSNSSSLSLEKENKIPNYGFLK